MMCIYVKQRDEMGKGKIASAKHCCAFKLLAVGPECLQGFFFVTVDSCSIKTTTPSIY